VSTAAGPLRASPCYVQQRVQSSPELVVVRVVLVRVPFAIGPPVREGRWWSAGKGRRSRSRVTPEGRP
jgi:hypothetical protein